MHLFRWTGKCILLMTLMIIVASGCAAPQAPAQPAAPAEEQPAAAEPATVSEGPVTLVIGLAEDTKSLDPERAYETHAFTVNQAIYQTLVTFPPDRVDEIIPGLAESWTISEDGLKYTFQLKEGQIFSTGRPVTARDVVFSFKRLANLKGNPSFLADNIANVEAPDDLTVIITLSEPDPSMLARLVGSSFGVIDSEEARAHGATDAEDAAETDTAEEWLNQHSIGSGPYMLEKWEPNVETILVRNPKYTGEPAAIERVIYRTMNEAAAQKIALEAGDVDIALDVTPDQVVSLKNNPDITVYEGVSDWVFFLLMNMDPEIGGPMSKDPVQDAVRLALDYDGIRALGGGAAATPVNIMLVHWPYALDQSRRIQRDVEAAKAKLAEAGYPDGFTVDLDYPEFSIAGVSWSTLAQKVQADLAEAGIDVKLKPAEVQVSLEQYRNGEQGFSLWVWHPDLFDPIDRTAFMPGGKVGLRANWPYERASAELVEVTKQALVESDPAKRAEIFTQAQELMLDESPFAFLVQPGLQVAYRNEVQGFVYNNQWRIDPYTMSK